ncbi:MAG: DUF177 domain-containing protein [Tidjanibacter sp.]|nr:DUF177 domain-containing protein [Tidjanibacter sp.]
MIGTEQFVIPFKGYKVGVHEFEFALNDEFLEAIGDEELIGVDAVAKVTLTKAASMLTFDVEIAGTVSVECDRCLDELALPVEISDRLYVKFSEDELDFDGEVMWLNPADSQIDLADYIYETLLLALPYQRVHESIEECNQEMIAKFQIVSQEEFDQMAEPQSNSLGEGEMADKLAALKQQMEAQE